MSGFKVYNGFNAIAIREKKRKGFDKETFVINIYIF